MLTEQAEFCDHHDCEALFLIMTELTTGVIFLLSSVYGSGQMATSIQAVNAQVPAPVVVQEIADGSSFTDSFNPKIVEAYLRKEFANEPILVDIARCESNFKQFSPDGKLIRGMVDRDDVGVMQINERYQGDTAKKLNFDLHTLEGNAAYAKHLYKEQGSKPWSASSSCWG